MSDLFESPALGRIELAPEPPVPADAVCEECGGTSFWSGVPPICRGCRKPLWNRVPAEPLEQEVLPGFPEDPVPHAPPTPEPEPAGSMDIREALRRLRDYRTSLPDSVRAAADAILDRLEAEYPPEPKVDHAACGAVQEALFELGAPAQTVSVAEPIRVYVHFERSADVAEFGARVGVEMNGSVRAMKYRRDRADAVDAPAGELERGARDENPEDRQVGLFGDEEWWKPLWAGMPEFEQRDLSPVRSIDMVFDSAADVEHFEEKIGQSVPRGAKRTPSIWFPEAEIGRMAGLAWRTPTPVDPRHPVFVISKGRYEKRLTQTSFERAGIPYRIVVEPQEVDLYADHGVPREKILATPFSNLGQGSIPSRNFCWETAVAEGHKRHWVVDDNIDGLWRLHQNRKLRVETGATLRAIEDWSDRYENVGLSGPQYFMFASRKTKIAPLALNTRVYSCILVNHALDGVLAERWRGRYNEDTDLSLRALKAGWCTALFNAFLILKATTMTMKGGNTEALYKIQQGAKDGRLLMAESLRDQHPDVTKIVHKWGRYQHDVNYDGFRQNKLALRPDAWVLGTRHEYGMELVDDGTRRGTISGV